MQHRVWLVAGLGVTLMVASTVAIGCSSNTGSALTPVTQPTPKQDSGTASSGDSGMTTKPGDGGTQVPPGDGGTNNTATLYGRLGGHAGIRAAVNAVVAAEVLDPDIASFFVFQAGAPANDHPTVDQIEECFTDFIGAQKVVGGTETYPTTVTTDGGMFACRDMMTAHAAFNISGGTFDKFVAIAGGVLQAHGVTNADLSTLATALESTKPQITNATEYDAGEMPYDASAE
jgi:hypothetical protein